MSVDLLPFQIKCEAIMPYLGRSQLRLPTKEIRSASNNNGKIVQKKISMCQLKVKA